MAERLLLLMRRLSPRAITTLGLLSLALLFTACAGGDSCTESDPDYPECLGTSPE